MEYEDQHTVMLLVTYYDIKYNVIVTVGLVVVRGKSQLDVVSTAVLVGMESDKILSHVNVCWLIFGG